MSWPLAISPASDFSLQNLPYGIYSTDSDPSPRIGVAVGDDFVLNLKAISQAGILQNVGASPYLETTTLNDFMGQEASVWKTVRSSLQALLSSPTSPFPSSSTCVEASSSVTMHLPCTIGDYTDFYSSREHATNVGTMVSEYAIIISNSNSNSNSNSIQFNSIQFNSIQFNSIQFRGPDNALQPNWLHLPVGYHGRASSIFLSGSDAAVVRPSGQLQKNATEPKEGSTYGPCRLCDFELEMAIFVGGPTNPPGTQVTMDEAEDRIFGFVVMNDWSARDIQKWEYVPLGPFGAKNWATTISPWVVTPMALEPFKCKTSAGEQVDPTPLPYLIDKNYGSYDIKLGVDIQGDGMAKPEVIQIHVVIQHNTTQNNTTQHNTTQH